MTRLGVKSTLEGAFVVGMNMIPDFSHAAHLFRAERPQFKGRKSLAHPIPAALPGSFTRA